VSGSDLGDVGGGGALLARDDVVLHAVPLGERLEAVALDRRVVDEAVLRAILRRDESESLAVVEPLHFSGNTHSASSLSWFSPETRKGPTQKPGPSAFTGY